MLVSIEPPTFPYGRKQGFQTALSLIKEIHNPLIVEVGMLRGEDEAESNGHSTKVFADFIRKIRQHENRGLSRFISVDLSQDAVLMCESELKKHDLLEYAQLICSDALTFMATFELCYRNNSDLNKIDFLYVDGWDYGQDLEINEFSENSTLEFIQLSESFLSDNAVILFDDVYDNEWKGKAKKAIPYLLSKQWICVYSKDNQAVLIRNIYKV